MYSLCVQKIWFSPHCNSRIILVYITNFIFKIKQVLSHSTCLILKMKAFEFQLWKCIFKITPPLMFWTDLVYMYVSKMLIERRQEKTCLQGFRPGPTQTS